MNAYTKMSEKGQVVIPKDVRDRLRMASGDRLEVVERSDGVLLRKAFERSGESFEAITARIRARVQTATRTTSIAEMNDAVSEMWAQGGPRWDQ
ncbi:AbrB/MazE/SpoVT family DNA-binding domain-containing protein [Sphingomonas sp. RP10(2022)]|uniref:AbrB/MazE/SpoVT family DNA-binding domain-containing protein n=1 Tax=Sphingomonas liriopis TaxID=2949094 RepID=A0A9X2KRX8_9SPHN|nr:AbrB/MazE/SpoVT family DNA-binding domain-containing protein [Sphingomonas liriopis]MCP3736106.1 AbrB/MazE/SpoVT family DNA-binding domain-containing protein [Sphingomonas liriopis]